MKKSKLLLALMFPALLLAQNYLEVDTLNYNQVFLEVAPQQAAVTYEFHLIDVGQDKAVLLQDSLPAVIAGGLDWGHTYQWYATLRDKSGKQVQTTALSAFYLKPAWFENALKIKTVGRANWEGLLFLDMDKIAVDQDGKLVWYYPENKSKQIHQNETRDLELISSGELSIIAGSNAYLFDLKGNILDEFPKIFDEKGNEINFYHHEIIPAADGTFFILGKEVMAQQKSNVTSLAQIGQSKSTETLEYSVIYQYNRSGNLLWKWSSSSYFPESLVHDYPVMKEGKTIGHMNSLALSPDGKSLLVGFRNLNKLLLVSYPDGEVIMTIGDKLPMESSSFLEKSFSKQHAAFFTNSDTVLLFNNNDCGLENKESSIQMLQLNAQKQEAKMIFDIVPLTAACANRLGNVLQTQSGNFLVNMGTVPEVLEVDKSGKKMWSLQIYSFDSLQSSRTDHNNYRIFHSTSLFPYKSSFVLNGSHLIIYNTGSNPQTFIIYDKDNSNNFMEIETESRTYTKVNSNLLPDTFYIISAQTKKAKHFRDFE